MLLLILLTEFVSIKHRPWMHFSEMIILVDFELILANILVELIEENKIIVGFEPLVTNNIGWRANLLVRAHFILLFQKLELLVLVE